MPLTSGARLGSYEIVSAIGAGGMGEVYRARDTVLNRDVAIKIVPDLFVGDPERMARFAREAQTLAALNHPNIAHVYGLEGTGLVMELVDGEDLAQRLTRVHDLGGDRKRIFDGASAPVVSGVLYNNGGAGHFSVSSTGTFAYMSDFGTRTQAELLWVDRAGRTTTVDAPRGQYNWPELSPDATRVALQSSTSQGRQNIVVWDFGRHALTSVTRDSAVSEFPVWMPDGASLLFASRVQLGALGRLFRQRADGAGTPTQITSGSLRQIYASGGEYAGAVLSEGTKIIYAVTGTDADGIKLLDLTTGQTQMLVQLVRRVEANGSNRCAYVEMIALTSQHDPDGSHHGGLHE
jgi:protein kinase-like protein/WD40 repeat protein